MPLTPVEELDHLLPECRTLINSRKLNALGFYQLFWRNHASRAGPGSCSSVSDPRVCPDVSVGLYFGGYVNRRPLRLIKRLERLLKIAGSSANASEDPLVGGSRGKESMTCEICGRTGHAASHVGTNRTSRVDLCLLHLRPIVFRRMGIDCRLSGL